MQDQSCYPLGHLGGAEVGVQSTLDGQDILIRAGRHRASAWPACSDLARQTSSGKGMHTTGASSTTGRWTTCWSSSSTS